MNADYGPSVTRNHEGRLVSRGPGVVVLETREDLDREPDARGNRPVVRGARRRTVLSALMDDGTLTKRQGDAARHFLDDLSRASGGSSASFMSAMSGGGGGSRDGMTELQGRAIRAVWKVRLMLGLSPDTVFWWVIIQNQSLNSYDARHRLRHGTGAGWLRTALDALDEHYNPAGRGKDHG